MTRRSLIENAFADRSVILHAEACEGCGTPFSVVDRSALRPIDLSSRLHSPRLRRLPSFALLCSCGRSSLLFRDLDGGLVVIDPDLIKPVAGSD